MKLMDKAKQAALAAAVKTGLSYSGEGPGSKYTETDGTCR